MHPPGQLVPQLRETERLWAHTHRGLRNEQRIPQRKSGQRELLRPAPLLLREIFFDSYDLIPTVSNLQSRYGAILMPDEFHRLGAPKRIIA